jgi:hypothetical protein
VTGFGSGCKMMRESERIGGENESGPRTGKRKRAGRMQARCSPDRRDAVAATVQGGVARRTAKRKPATGVAGWKPDAGTRSVQGITQ